MSMFSIFNVAGSAMTAQSQRLNVVSSNIANADSTTSATGQPYRVKQVVFAAQEMGGSLVVQSDGPGKGATFTLQLPVNGHGKN